MAREAPAVSRRIYALAKTKARLGWAPTIGFSELAREMVESDYIAAKRDSLAKLSLGNQQRDPADEIIIATEPRGAGSCIGRPHAGRCGREFRKIRQGLRGRNSAPMHYRRPA